jgi:hypothetical protein
MACLRFAVLFLLFVFCPCANASMAILDVYGIQRNTILIPRTISSPYSVLRILDMTQNNNTNIDTDTTSKIIQKWSIPS